MLLTLEQLLEEVNGGHYGREKGITRIENGLQIKVLVGSEMRWIGLASSDCLRNGGKRLVRGGFFLILYLWFIV